MNVDKIMSKSLITVKLDDKLKAVKVIFDNANIHHLLVVEADKLFGVVSDRDMLKAISPNIGTLSETNRDTISLNKRVHQIMTSEPVTLAPDAEISDAIEIFNNHDISCIPVVDDKNKPVGIISWRDIIKAIKL
ncbi:MAG: CBS domain-containing protein [Candidatus Brocadiales bacterium]|nr:CBS domain-containing protein [Candidatus Brocadiales bacterium]